MFHELIHGDRPDLIVRSIASSDFSILCLIDWETARLISDALGRLIETYKIIMGLKEKIEGLREDGVPEEALKDLINHANEKMKTTVEALTEEITTTHPDGKVSVTRKKELKIEMCGALGEVASRIDKGFSFEIRTGALTEAPENEDKKSAAARKIRADHQAAIAAKQPSLEYIKTSGPPILSLPGLPQADDLAGSKKNPPA